MNTRILLIAFTILNNKFDKIEVKMSLKLIRNKQIKIQSL